MEKLLNYRIRNRYLVLAGALLAQITIAGLYAWSIFGTAIQAERGWGSDEILFAYALAQFVFAFCTLFSGRLVDAKGPRPALLIGGVLYGGGLILSSFASTPLELYLSYGVLTGAGVGFVYVCPLATLVKWFPDHKGMITGLSVAVFGGGSILFQEIISRFLVNSDAAGAFLRLGLLSAFLIISGALLTNNPEDFSKDTLKKRQEDFTTAQMVRTGTFYKVWFMYWFAVIPGLLVLGAAKNIGLEVAGLTTEAATSLISILALSNAGSRLLSGTLADRFGPMNVLKGVFVLNIISLLALSFLAQNQVIFYFGVIGIALSYGGFLALVPTFTNQTFGSHHYGSNYGVIFQAYGLAALSGIFIKSLAGSYANTFLISAAAAAVALFLAAQIKDT